MLAFKHEKGLTFFQNRIDSWVMKRVMKVLVASIRTAFVLAICVFPAVLMFGAWYDFCIRFDRSDWLFWIIVAIPMAFISSFVLLFYAVSLASLIKQWRSGGLRQQPRLSQEDYKRQQEEYERRQEEAKARLIPLTFDDFAQHFRLTNEEIKEIEGNEGFKSLIYDHIDDTNNLRWFHTVGVSCSSLYWDNGEDINLRARDGAYHFFVVCLRQGRIPKFGISDELFCKLLWRDDQRGVTSLHSAASNSDVEVLKYLVSQGDEVNAKDYVGDTPLHRAAAGNTQVEVFQYLVSQGADVNAKDNTGWTPLHYAATNSNVEVLKYLVSQGADVNAKANEGLTPLHRAKTISHVQYLISQGAEVKAKTDSGLTPLHLASSDSDVEVLQYLISQGADGINAKGNPEGWTPLRYAAGNNSLEVLQYLISQGADATAKDNNGKTPLDATSDPQKIEFLRDVIRHGEKTKLFQ